MMNVQLDSDTMQALVQKAILDSMTPETRQELLTKAIQYLTTTSTERYGNKISPITEAYQNAARQVANELVKTELEANPLFKANLKSLFEDVSAKLFASEIRDKVVQKISDAVVSGLNARDY